MHKLLYLFLALFLLTSVRAQDSQYLTKEESDPKATARLDEMEAFLGSYDLLHCDFTMKVLFMDDEPTVINGEFFRENAMFKVITPEYVIYCDGENRWTHDQEAGEVMIERVDPDQPTSPIDYLQLYKTEDFVYVVSGESESGDTQIEFKPLDKHSEYMKLRLTVANSDSSPQMLEVFQKGGSRITLSIDALDRGASRPVAWYRFNPEEHPGVHIEDLRID